MLIAARNAMMAGKRLPYDAEVEYLRFTSRAYTNVREYIDTGVVPDETFEFEIDVLWNIGRNTNYGQEPISSRRADSADTDVRFMLSSYYINGYSFCGAGPAWKYSIAQPSNVRLHYEFHNRTLTTSFDGNHVFPMPDNMVPMRPVWLGAANSSTEGICNPFGGNIYTCKLWLNNTLVRDYIPVRFTNENGVSEGAMFDRANPTMGVNPDGSARNDGLYRNRGTGAFIVGPDVAASNGGGHKRKCVRRSYRRSLWPSARRWRAHLWKEVA